MRREEPAEVPVRNRPDLVARLVALAALVLVVVGISRVEPLIRNLRALEEGKRSALAATVHQQQDQLNNLAASVAEAYASRDSLRAQIADAHALAEHAGAAVRTVRSELEPITEQLDTVSGQFVALRTTTDQLATADSTLGRSVAKASSDLDSVRTTIAANRQATEEGQKHLQALIDAQDDELDAVRRKANLGFWFGAVMNTGINALQIAEPRKIQEVERTP